MKADSDSLIGADALEEVGFGEGVGLRKATPLFQTCFFPVLTHVYFIPAIVEVLPTFVHGEPALTAPKAVRELAMETIAVSVTAEITFRMPKR